MQVVVVAVGRLKSGPDRELFDRYWQRFEVTGRSAGVSRVRLVELPESRAANVDVRRDDEGQRCLKAVADDAFVVALDETGKQHSSEAFAALFQRWAGERRDQIAFIIGGADGHGAAVRTRANMLLGLGAMTLPHGLARIVVAEQLYRATTILTGHPYHRSG